MYAKSFIALDGNGRPTGAKTAQRYPYDCYTCHLCGSALQYHPEYDTKRPYFEHRSDMLTDNGRQHCPYVRPEPYLMSARWFTSMTGTAVAAAAITMASATA
ncbi:hypothetical protein NUKP47_17400 [Klebsiella quasipneumoniae]|nr:hypothetical protein NUKP47_17400 [Klebsiella quasipneumoniae]